MALCLALPTDLMLECLLQVLFGRDASTAVLQLERKVTHYKHKVGKEVLVLHARVLLPLAVLLGVDDVGQVHNQAQLADLAAIDAPNRVVHKRGREQQCQCKHATIVAANANVNISGGG